MLNKIISWQKNVRKLSCVFSWKIPRKTKWQFQTPNQANDPIATTANAINHASLATDVETIQFNCNNFENKLTEDFRSIDNQQMHLQNRINELENVLTIASNEKNASQSYTDLDDGQTYIKLNEKVRTYLSKRLSSSLSK